MEGMEEGSVRFVADSMLGRLAKWLRVLGYDTVYLPRYEGGELDRFVREGRRLLSRHRQVVEQYGDSMFIASDHVGEQLAEVKEKAPLSPEGACCFTRCLRCNRLLEEADRVEARENVPEYVFYQDMMEIRTCPSCGRFFWPGSHRKRMEEQLKRWGFLA